MGVGVVDRAGDTLTLDPADCFGAVWSFVEQDIPNPAKLKAKENYLSSLAAVDSTDIGSSKKGNGYSRKSTSSTSNSSLFFASS